MKKSNVVISIVCGVLLVLILALVLFLYFQRNDTTKPETTINSFVSALNDDNINGMLDCIEPSEAQTIRNGISKLESYTGKSFDKLIELLPFISFVSSTDLFPEYSVEILSTQLSDDGTTAIVQITATPIDTESSQSLSFDVNLIKIQDVWYIRYATPITGGESL